MLRLALPAILLLMLACPARAASIHHVIHISVDGLRGDVLKTLVANNLGGRFSNFKRFEKEGVFTYNARTDLTRTNTLPNHTTMFTGRPADQPAGRPNTVHHGYTDNSIPQTAWTLHNRGNPNLSYIVSTFDVAHDNGRSTGLYASKPKFAIYRQSYDTTNGAPDTIGPDNGRCKIDSYVNKFTIPPRVSSNLHDDFIADMAANRFHYVFVHYADPDVIGHAVGWDSGLWKNTVANVDAYLGDIFKLIENDALLKGRTAIIVTADHGGIGTGHSDATNAANYTIPFLVWGPGVAAGANLYALNPASRQDPGMGRPDYNAPLQPIRSGDVANLALKLLGLAAVPGSTINPAQGLNVQNAIPERSTALPFSRRDLSRTSATTTRPRSAR